ncbi:MAG: sugar ABC transporter permease [Anaerolineales bacterium]|nr:sugar ABC transporter permease [Anaerolineales bacterium]
METPLIPSQPADTSETMVEPHRIRLRLSRIGPLYLLILPSVLFLLVFIYYPAISGFFTSFTFWTVKGSTWVGWENYEKILADTRLIASVSNLVQLTVFNVIVVITMPLLAAALIFHLPHKRVQYWLRVVFVFPMIVPMVVTIMVWRWMYSLDGGINIMLNLIGLSEWTRAWLGDRDVVLYALMFTNFPWIAGLNFLIYLAGLQNIPQELLDAAVVDGASSIRRFFKVELPLIRGQMRLLVLLTVIYWLRSFELPLIMTDGGPGWSSMVPGLRMYHTVSRDFNLGYGSAIGMVLFAVVLVVTLIQLRLTRSGDEVI